jgi:hypothetical protein
MRQIKLNRGYVTLVDDEDYEYLNQFKWYLNSNGYARTTSPQRMYMHALINKPPVGLQTDHVNRDKLDNRRSNLRSVTPLENSRNHGIHPTNTSGHPGVSWTKTDKWEVYIWLKNKKKHIGRFAEFKDAVKARKQAERLYYV